MPLEPTGFGRGWYEWPQGWICGQWCPQHSIQAAVKCIIRVWRKGSTNYKGSILFSLWPPYFSMYYNIFSDLLLSGLSNMFCWLCTNMIVLQRTMQAAPSHYSNTYYIFSSWANTGYDVQTHPHFYYSQNYARMKSTEVLTLSAYIKTTLCMTSYVCHVTLCR